MPAFLRRREILLARWIGDPADYRMDRYRCTTELRRDDEYLTCDVTIQPTISALAIERKGSEFASQHGVVEYIAAPDWLLTLDKYLREHAGRKRTYRWRREPGPWEYLPHETFPDWRIRARQKLPAPSPPALVNLLTYISYSASLYDDARLTIDYERDAKNFRENLS